MTFSEVRFTTVTLVVNIFYFFFIFLKRIAVQNKQVKPFGCLRNEYVV